MRALVLGGTRFVGAAIVDELKRRGAEITLFSRGQTNPSLFSELDRVHGDRAADLGRLEPRRFDVVFDSSGYTPAQVQPAGALAATHGAFYVFVSTVSVYALDASVECVTEEHPVRALEPGREADAPESYGAAKAACEAALREALGHRLAVLRAGLIVGPRDYNDRYPYWVWRLGEGGEVLAPGDGADPAQLIDARDLARFAVHLAERATPGVFNVSGPGEPATFADLLAKAAPAGRELDLLWADAGFLAEQGVAPWQDMPCWLPRDHDQAAMVRLDLRRALDAGLVLRDWSETATDTRRWMRAVGRAPPFTSGLSSERERELIAALRQPDRP